MSHGAVYSDSKKIHKKMGQGKLLFTEKMPTYKHMEKDKYKNIVILQLEFHTQPNYKSKNVQKINIFQKCCLCLCTLYQFPGADITNYHKAGGFKTMEIYSLTV